MNEELIKRLKNNTDFLEFSDYILDVIVDMDTVNGLDNFTNESAGEEAKVRLKTKLKLYKILKPFVDFQEKTEPTEEEIKKAKNKYGL